MIDDFIAIIADEDFSDMLDYSEPTIMSGVNIKTGSYGLFLIALDECKDDKEQAILNDAIDALDDIQDCTMSNAMDPYYPPDNLNYITILKLANVILQLNDITEGEHADKVSKDNVNKFTQIACDTLGFRLEYLEDKYIEEETSDKLIEDES